MSTSTSPVIVLSRSVWGADPTLPRLGTLVPPAQRTEVFIHHTVVVDNDTTVNTWETQEEVGSKMRQLQTMRPDLGLDVPYNFVAFCLASGDLVLAEGRGLDRSGAHTSGHNTSALGIAFQGNFELTPLPVHLEAQLAGLSGWLHALRTEHGFVHLGDVRPQGRDVWGHHDVKATACPGAHLITRLPQICFVDNVLLV